MRIRFARLIFILVFCLFFLLFTLSDVDVVYADLTNEFFATNNGNCPNWENIANSLGSVDSIYATVSNKIPVCNWKFIMPFNIPTGSKINSIKVRVYNSNFGNFGSSSMSPAYNGIQSCVPPPFFPALIFNNVHEYLVTPINCPTTFPTLTQLNNASMSWHFYNSGNITVAVDAISMQVAYTPTTPTPTPSPTPVPGPEPFLDLPWDYTGMTFNEAALSINSYFDHTYPLLGGGLFEPNSFLNQITTFMNENSTTKDYSSHDGYDYGNFAEVHNGDPVLAAASGVASYINSCSACGNMIVIDHGNGYQTRYMHLQKDGLLTSTPGEKINVLARQMIGKVGSTGNSTGAHIHFGVFEDKNKDGNFEDNVPDGVTDPFGWQSKELDPWEIFSFFYNGLDRTGNKSYYLWKEKIDKLDATLTSNGGVFNTERYELDFPQNSVLENIKLSIQSAPIVKTLDNLRSIGSTIVVNAFDALGNAVTDFNNPFMLKVDFSSIDLSAYNLDTISIYSSTDGISWIKEPTAVGAGIATSDIYHLSHFALMAERLDVISPITTAVLNGLQGQENWFRSDVYVNLNPDDGSGLGVDYTLYKREGEDWETYVDPLIFTTEGHHKLEFYSVDKDGNIEKLKSVEFNIDKTMPVIFVNKPLNDDVYLLNQIVQVDYSCSDEDSGLESCVGTKNNNTELDTSSIGTKPFNIDANDNAGNKLQKTVYYKVQYLGNGLCLGNPGHAILQPINTDGTSIFKQGSTIPVKFRVCDNNGLSIGSPYLIKSFNLEKIISGTIVSYINESVNSTTPESSFHWDIINQQWIFNMSTKNLSAGKTYFYRFVLNDLTDVKFSFGLR